MSKQKTPDRRWFTSLLTGLCAGLLSSCWATSRPLYFSQLNEHLPEDHAFRYNVQQLQPESGQSELLFATNSPQFWPSPEGSRMAYLRYVRLADGERQSELVCYELASRQHRVLRAATPGFSFWSVDWSPDGKQLVYSYSMYQKSLVYHSGAALLDLESGFSFDLNLPGQFQSISQPVWSPDGKQLAANLLPSDKATSQLALYDMSRRSWQILPQRPPYQTASSIYHRELAWKPDGSGLIFQSWWDGHLNLHSYTFSSGQFSQLTAMESAYYSQLSPDGHWILFRGRCSKEQDCLAGKPKLDRTEFASEDLGGLYRVNSDGSGLIRLLPGSMASRVDSFQWQQGTARLQVLYRAKDDKACTVFTTQADGSDKRCLLPAQTAP